MSLKRGRKRLQAFNFKNFLDVMCWLPLAHLRSHLFVFYLQFLNMM